MKEFPEHGLWSNYVYYIGRELEQRFSRTHNPDEAVVLGRMLTGNLLDTLEQSGEYTMLCVKNQKLPFRDAMKRLIDYAESTAELFDSEMVAYLDNCDPDEDALAHARGDREVQRIKEEGLEH